jgi:ribosomal protein S18 acetylase RimI-like enzyme
MSLGNPERAIGGLAVRVPEGVELRPIGRSDLVDVVAMARAAHGASSEANVDELRPRFEALLASADVAPFVAESRGEALGIGILQFRRRLNFTTFEGWISDLYVQPAARGQGIGRALLDALVAEWRLRGGHRVQVQVPDQSPAAEALFREAGFEAWMLDFALRPVADLPLALPAGVTLRPAGPDDGPAVTDLLSEFGAPRTPPPERTEAVLRTYEDHLRRVGAGQGRTIVAELEGAVVGVSSLEWRTPFWTTERQAWLADLIVTERARGRGIGRALLADAIHAATTADAAEISLESGQSREAAHALYRSSGFEGIGWTYRMLRADR